MSDRNEQLTPERELQSGRSISGCLSCRLARAQCARCAGGGDSLHSRASTLTSAPGLVIRSVPCPPPVDPLIGTVAGADYVIRELVGRGGMGRVYRAEQARLGRDVAIKVLHPHLLGDEHCLARFYTEAQAASRLSHPNSVAVIDFGVSPAGAPYLVMEFLRGQHLRSMLRQQGPLPARAALRIAIEVLSALAEAHACGVVHRDLKPENIFLVPRREGGHHVKVVDFGLARISTPNNPQPSQPGWTGGTPGYTAPEQWTGEPTDGRTDLYALGVVLFEMLTGLPPFAGDTATLLRLHLSQRAPLLSEAAPGQSFPPAMDEIARRALEKRADDRFDSAEQMASRLQEALDGLAAPSSPASWPPPPGPSPAAGLPPRPPPAPASRRLANPAARGPRRPHWAR